MLAQTQEFLQRSNTMEKRGLSAIVATVLLIMITVVVAGIIAAFIIPFARNNLKSSTECFPLQDALKFDPTLPYNCYSSGGKNGVSVKANYGKTITLSSFALSFIKQGTSERVVVKADATTSQLTMLSGAASLEVPKSGELRTYVYNAGKSFDAVEIYPIAASGNLCPKSDSINLDACEGDALG